MRGVAVLRAAYAPTSAEGTSGRLRGANDGRRTVTRTMPLSLMNDEEIWWKGMHERKLDACEAPEEQQTHPLSSGGQVTRAST